MIQDHTEDQGSNPPALTEDRSQRGDAGWHSPCREQGEEKAAGEFS